MASQVEWQPWQFSLVICPGVDVFICLSPVDNLWGAYGPAGMLVEKKGLPSTATKDSSNDKYKPYVFNDIATYFTLLVGIYFPSVTGNPCSVA